MYVHNAVVECSITSVYLIQLHIVQCTLYTLGIHIITYVYDQLNKISECVKSFFLLFCGCSLTPLIVNVILWFCDAENYLWIKFAGTVWMLLSKQNLNSNFDEIIKETGR